MTRRPPFTPLRRRARGNTPLVTAWLLLLLGLVSLTLYRAATRQDSPARPRREVYLSDEVGAVAAARRARREQTEAVIAKARRARKARQGSFRHADAAALFAGLTGAGDRAVHQETRDLLASPDILLRLFGTPDGDFLFHRRLGWLRYIGGQWIPMRPDELPGALRDAHPDLVGAAGPGGGPGAVAGAGGDAAFQAEQWMGGAGAAEEQG